MYTVLIVFHIFISIALIAIVLIQRNDTDGLGGLGGGSMSGFMTGRASANLLTRTTALLATLFIVSSLALGIVVAQNRGQGSLAEQIMQQQSTEKPAIAPGAPATPVAPKPEKPKATPSVPKPE